MLVRLSYVLGAAVALAVLLWAVRPGCHTQQAGMEACVAADIAPPVRLAIPARIAHPDVVEPKRLVSCSGRVLDAGGRPLPGITLWACGLKGDEELVGRTDAHGTFRVEVASGAPTLMAGDPDGPRATLDLGASSGAAADRCIRLEGVEALAGIVRRPDGAPVASAEVSASGYRFGRATTLTQADGTFRVAVPTRTEFLLHVEAGAQGRATRYGLWWAADTPIEVDLPPVFAIRGRVVCANEAGEQVGVQGVRVRAFAFEQSYYGGLSAHGGSWAGDGVLTSADGRFTYPGIVDCRDLYVLSDAWYQLQGPVDWHPGEEPLLVVHRRAAVSGVVVGPDEQPVPFAAVSGGGRARIESARSTVADAHGRFILPGIAVGVDRMRVRATSGALRGSATIRGQTGCDVTDLIVRLVATRSVRGRLVDPAGHPIAGAYVRVESCKTPGNDANSWSGDSVWSDGDGDFLVTELPEEPVSLAVDADDCESLALECVHATLEGTDVGTLILVWRPEQRVRVTDEGGAAVSAAVVQSLPVNAEGIVLIRPPDGDSFKLRVEAPGFVKRDLMRSELPAEGDWNVVLRRSRLVVGRVIDVDGRPICGARVDAWGTRGGSKAFSTLDGRFRVEVPCEGTYRVSAWDLFHEYPAAVDVRTTESTTLIQAVLPCQVAGRLLDTNGRGVEGITLYASAEGGGRSRNATTDADGAFRIERLVGETFRLSASSSDLTKQGLRARDVRGIRRHDEHVLMEAEPLDTVRGPLTLRGRIVWPDGRPASGAEVSAEMEEDDDWNTGTTESGEDGSFVIQGLAAGRYSVSAWACVEIDADREVDYEGEAGAFDAGAKGLRIVLRALPLDPDEDDSAN